MSYLRAHILVSFHSFVQGFLPRKYSAVSSLALNYITLLYIFNESLFAHIVFSSLSVYNGIIKRRQNLHSNDYEEKGWSAYKIWEDHSSKNWTYTSVKRLLKHFKDSGTREEKSGRLGQ